MLVALFSVFVVVGCLGGGENNSSAPIVTDGYRSVELAIKNDPPTPAYKIVTGGAIDQVIGHVQLKTDTQAVSLEQISLKLTNGTSADLSQVTIWDGAEKIGSAVFIGRNNIATTTLSPAILIPANSKKTLSLKADFSSIGVNQAGGQGHLVAVDVTSAKGIGIVTRTTVDSTGSTAFTGVRMFRSYPMFAPEPVTQTTLVAGVADLYRFSVSTSALGDGIGLAKLTFSIKTSVPNDVSGTMTVTSIKVYGYSDPGFSSPISGPINGQIVATIPALASNGMVIATLASVLQVPANSTLYFKVVGDVGLTPGTGTFAGAITTSLLGDASYPVQSPIFMVPVASLSDSNLVWSPNWMTSSTETDSDWTNGFGVAGLPSDHLQSTTISK